MPRFLLPAALAIVCVAACSPSNSGSSPVPGTVTVASTAPGGNTPLTPGSSAGPSTAPASGTVFTPGGLVTLTMDNKATSLANSGLVLTADQANGVNIQVGVDAKGQIKDNYYQVDVMLTGLAKAPGDPNFGKSDVGTKALKFETVVDGQRTIYSAADPSSITLFIANGKMDVSYTGHATKDSGSSLMKSDVVALLTLQGLPLTK